MKITWDKAWPMVDSVFGWLTEPEARRLFDLASECPVGAHIVELGAFMGRSTAALGLGLWNSESPQSQSKVISIDTWVGTKGAEEESLHEQIMAEHGCKDMYTLHSQNMTGLGLWPESRRIRGRTVPDGIEWANDWGIDVHLLFIDADHRYEAVKADFDAWQCRIIRPGGLVAFHDKWAPGPSRVISEMPPEFVRLEDAGELAVFRQR